MIRSVILTALAVLSAGAARADDTDRFLADLRSQRTGFAIVESLTTEIGPRLAGSPAMARALDWGDRTLKQAGLVNVHRETFTMDGWSRGAESAEITAPTPFALTIVGLGRTVPTPAGGIEAEIAQFDRFSDLMAVAPGGLAGKIAVVTERMVQTDTGDGYRTAVMARTLGPLEAAKRGAVAYLLRSVGTDSHRIAHTGATHYAVDAPSIPAAALSNPDADQIERLTRRGAVRLRLTLASQHDPKATSANIVGEIPGTAKPEEIIVIGGHLDSWDQGTGAIDDGAGLAIVTAAAQAIAAEKTKPRRTIRVVLFGAEETDFSGPAYFAAHHDEVGRIALTAEADFGAAPAYMVKLPAGIGAAPFGKGLDRHLRPLGALVAPDPAQFAGSDVEPLHEAGAPIASIAQHGWTYFDIHHTPDDTLDKIDPVQLQQAVAVWAAVIDEAARSDQDFHAAESPKAAH